MNGTLGQVLETKEAGMVHMAVAGETVLSAVQRMTDLGIGSLLVVDHHRRPVGIFTERDVLRRIVAAGRSPEDTPVDAVMTHPVMCVRSSMTVAAGLALCAERRFRRLPIVRGRRAVGLLTLGDLTRWLVERQRLQITELNDYIWGP